ncbi:MAG: DUF2249 domain-containing protein [Verrucomicrobiota bacterium]
MKPKTFKTLDVRPRLARGEEPFSAIRARVDALGDGQGVTILAPFMPAPLIEMLRSEGFASAIEHRADGAWAVSFWRESAGSRRQKPHSVRQTARRDGF